MSTTYKEILPQYEKLLDRISVKLIIQADKAQPFLEEMNMNILQIQTPKFEITVLLK